MIAEFFHLSIEPQSIIFTLNLVVQIHCKVQTQPEEKYQYSKMLNFAVRNCWYEPICLPN